MQYNNELEIIARKFFNHEISFEQATNRIIINIYNNKAYFGLEHFDEDSFHSFLIWLQKRLKRVLYNYNPKNGLFSAYCRQSIYLSRKSFLKFLSIKNLREKTMTQIYSITEEEREFQFNSKVYDLSCCNDDVECIQQENTSGHYKELINLLKKKGLQWSRIEMAENLRKAACLILTLKACYFVDSDIIRKVSSVTKLSEIEISELLNEVKQLASQKIKQHEYYVKSRDSAYFFHRRYMLESQKVKDSCSRSKEIKKRYEKQTKIWKNRLEMLKNKKYMGIPSNSQVAEILKISNRKIERILLAAKKNIDTISMKDYDINHETLSCNWQRKQKKRNEANS